MSTQPRLNARRQPALWVMGRSAKVCPTNILSLGALAAPFIFFVARRFAPVKLSSAGAAAGLLTAGLAATVYGLHCPEHTAAFVTVWYSLGMGLIAALGAALGRFAFRSGECACDTAVKRA
ncbi:MULTISPECIES: NrsF family protein [Brevundimonas]|uniref:NrsF family protein n=1 Tax=Brevundimonas TaxID=41275 RepID=UPI0025BFB8D9|nr:MULTISPECIES: NrsF family protein [Brevundimonas]